MEPGIDGTTTGDLPQVDDSDLRSGEGTVLTTARVPGQSRAPTMAPLPHHPGAASPQDRWPLRSYIELGALPSAVPCARLHTRHVLWEWGQKSLIADAELAVSEIVTNAIAASQAIESLHPVRLWLLSDSSRTLIMVGDASPHAPRRIDQATTDTDGGRGLMLVEAVSSNWGWYITHKVGIAKIIWAELHLLPADDPPANGSADE
jgi:anti-sigma regulatory factor (Ser/Thr protein kinase)